MLNLTSFANWRHAVLLAPTKPSRPVWISEYLDIAVNITAELFGKVSLFIYFLNNSS